MPFQIVEMIDQRLRRQLIEGAGRIAEADQDERHAGGFGGREIDLAIADHDGTGGRTPGKGDHAAQMTRIRL
jgi:hypothetical protein